MALGETGCAQEAWEHSVAQQIALDFGSSRGDLGDISQDDLVRVVWLLTVSTCRDRFPAEALNIGPP